MGPEEVGSGGVAEVTLQLVQRPGGLKKNVEGVQGTVWQETGVDRLAGLVTDPGNRGLTGC